MSLENQLSCDGPVYQQPVSWLQALTLNAKTALTKTMVPLYASYAGYRTHSPTPPRILTYPSHLTLNHRIHLPPNSKPGDTPPLLFEIHGGGFMLFDPSFEDGLCAGFARELGCVVVSLDYSKSPAAKFPVAVHEIVETIISILDDSSISYDRSRVVCMGYSAGATLTLSAAQSPRLQGRIQGIIPFFPLTEFLTSASGRALTRPYDTPNETDMLLSSIPLTNYAYIPVGQNLKDPLLSPHFAARATLPPWILMVGAEQDMLCKEAWLTSLKYAGLEAADKWEGDSPLKYGFEDKGVRWYMVKGAKHGFTHFMGGTGEEEERRNRQAAECNQKVYKWLREGPFAL